MDVAPDWFRELAMVLVGLSRPLLGDLTYPHFGTVPTERS
jgi:hypothetical protein